MRVLMLSVALLAPCGLFASVIDYYRFENNLVDSAGSNNAAILTGSAVYSANVPLNVPGAPDTSSLSLDTNTALDFNYAFPFDTNADATLQFYVNPVSTSNEQDLFWTTDSNSSDANRFNIGVGYGAVFMDYRSSDGTLHQLTSTGPNSLVAGQWNFVGIVKTGNQYAIYLNNLAPFYATDPNPDLPTSTGWTINGRSDVNGNNCCQFTGLLDEVSLSDTALSRSQLLDPPPDQSAPEPSVIWLAGAGLLAIASAKRRK